MTPKNIATRSVRAGLESDAHHGSVVPPIYLSSNFAFQSYRQPRKYDYTRSGNPTRDQLAGALADLEGGAGAIVTCTGLAAITLILSTLPAGARVVAPYDCYGGTYRLLTALQAKGNLVVDFVDQSNPAELRAALEAKPKLVWIETPSNPLLRVVDIRAITSAAHAAGALAAVDNTFLSPIWQQPLSLGADYVMHSTTKYLNGHSDVVGGAVIAATPELHETLAWWANAIGVTGAPFDSFLTLRGVRSLHARMRVHAENAASVVEFLTRHPEVSRVYYPGLADNPGYEIACRQQSGFGAMLSFELAGGEACRRGISHRPAVLYPGRILGRCGEPHCPSGEHDACRHGGIGAAASGDQSRTAARIGGHRRLRRILWRICGRALERAAASPLQRSQHRVGSCARRNALCLQRRDRR